jgi:hypothetical protein
MDELHQVGSGRFHRFQGWNGWASQYTLDVPELRDGRDDGACVSWQVNRGGFAVCEGCFVETRFVRRQTASRRLYSSQVGKKCFRNGKYGLFKY